MGIALYRKYRSKSLSDVIGQEHITKTLKKAFQQGKISHAYLLTGPRGVGKTSVARIIAHEINKLPYSDDSPHIDIIEIDAASNRRIDEIRDLREKVFTAPVSAAYKVYIIDEVHMLTREAFNALLKTLEEPPAHVVFILATTDAHKLPETIVSRTQRFSFKPVRQEQVAKHLKFIAEQEKLSVDDAALELLARHGEGSFRDSISLLDQVSGHANKITAADIQNLLGIPPEEQIRALYDALAADSAQGVMKKLKEMFESGYPAAIIAKEFSDHVRSKLFQNDRLATDNRTLKLLESLLDLAESSNPNRLLELKLLQSINPTDVEMQPVKYSKNREVPSGKEPAIANKKPVTDKSSSNITDVSVSIDTDKKVTTGKPFDMHQWSIILDTLKKRHNTLYGVIRMAEPRLIDERTLRLDFSFAFHQKRINEPVNRQILIDIIKEMTGSSLSVECTYNKKARPPKLPTTPKQGTNKQELDTISNIFGGGELLES